jgi:hypothetical protein
LNAFLKGEDDRGWTVPGKLPAVDMCIRDGSPKYNNAADELATFPRRSENEWPIARTIYQQYHFAADQTLSVNRCADEKVLHYTAPRYVPLFIFEADVLDVANIGKEALFNSKQRRSMSPLK